jgi:hypothetical protein
MVKIKISTKNIRILNDANNEIAKIKEFTQPTKRINKIKTVINYLILSGAVIGYGLMSKNKDTSELAFGFAFIALILKIGISSYDMFMRRLLKIKYGYFEPTSDNHMSVQIGAKIKNTIKLQFPNDPEKMYTVYIQDELEFTITDENDQEVFNTANTPNVVTELLQHRTANFWLKSAELQITPPEDLEIPENVLYMAATLVYLKNKPRIIHLRFLFGYLSLGITSTMLLTMATLASFTGHSSDVNVYGDSTHRGN